MQCVCCVKRLITEVNSSSYPFLSCFPVRFTFLSYVLVASNRDASDNLSDEDDWKK